MKRDAPSTAPVKTKARLLIVEARFYEAICDELARGAISAIEAAGATWKRIAVTGALELPGALAMAGKRYDGYVALGCVLRGETAHYDIVAHESARGIMDLTLQGYCVGNGVLTCDTEEQAWARARVTDGNKGAVAAEAALAMIRFKRAMAKSRAR